MSNNITRGIEDLLALFEPCLDAEDLLEAKLMSSVSTAITKERIRLNMSQKQFADYLGVQQSMVSRWEHGDYNFTIKKIAEIVAKLDIDVDIMFSNIDASAVVRRIAKANNYKGNNIYLFDEYKNRQSAFKSMSYTGGGWKNAAVR